MRVDLAPEFDAPAVRAKLDLLLLFAGTAREHLASLYEQLPNDYGTFLAVVADAVIEAIKTSGTPATVEEVWTSIQGAQRFQRLPKQERAEVMAAFETSLRANAANPEYARSYLDQANFRAVDWIGELVTELQQFPLTSVLQEVPARRLYLEYDADTSNACAAGSRTGSIFWFLQPQAFAFYGAMFAELQFVHEYLCHVLPTNRRLEKDIREAWLNDCVQYGIRNLADPHGEREPTKYVWARFLHLYQKHFATDDYGLGSSPSMDQLTRALSGKPLFWRITLSILSAPDGQAASDTISKLFNHLSRLTDRQLAALEAVQWDSLEELMAKITILKSIT